MTFDSKAEVDKELACLESQLSHLDDELEQVNSELGLQGTQSFDSDPVCRSHRSPRRRTQSRREKNEQQLEWALQQQQEETMRKQLSDLANDWGQMSRANSIDDSAPFQMASSELAIQTYIGVQTATHPPLFIDSVPGTPVQPPIFGKMSPAEMAESVPPSEAWQSAGAAKSCCHCCVTWCQRRLNSK